MPAPKPVTVDGITYSSMTKAARQLKIEPGNFGKWVRAGMPPSRRPGMAAPPMPVQVRGTVYATAREASEKLGVGLSTIYQAVDQGRADTLGQCNRAGARPIPITINGTTYSSHGNAAKTLGIAGSTISRAKANGTLAQLGARYAKK